MATQIGEANSLAIRGTKRKIPQDSSQALKKFRSCDSNDDLSSLQDAASESSNSDDSVEETHSIATLPTPQSPGSPYYPSNEKKIPCPFTNCPKLFNRQAKLEQHLRSHTNTRPFICPHIPCTKAYLRDSHLKHHIKSIHARIRDYTCTWEGCGKAFATGTRFRRHIAAHEGNTKTCSIDGCGLIFRKHSTLEAHIRSVHQGIKPHTCQFLDQASGRMCGMGFDKPAQLRSHEGRVHARNTYECTICPLDQPSKINRPAFPTYGALQEHIKTAHPPTCEQCGLACTSKSALKSHIEVKHGTTTLAERKQFICPSPGCGRSFTKKGNMHTHVQSAHEHKRYLCSSVGAAELKNIEGWDETSACGKEFGTRGNLQKHIRTAHMGFESSNKAPNRKAVRKNKKRSRSVVARITGASDEDSTMPCVMQGCNVEFSTFYELESHLQVGHGLAFTEIDDVMAIEEAEEVVYARPTLQGREAFATNEDLEAEEAFDMLGRGSLAQDADIDGTGNEAGFWLGGEEVEGGVAAAAADEWVREEEEMRRLISDEIYGGKVGERTEVEIDPTLL